MKLQRDRKDTGVENYDDLTYEDIDKGPYIGEYIYYVSNTVRSFMKASNELISYGSASGYMGSIKNDLLDKYSRIGIPTPLVTEVWKRKMTRIRSTKWEHCRKKGVAMFGSKESATDADRLGLIAICMWSGTLPNAEFMIFFQSMVMNCGRGSEIGITKLSNLHLKTIKEYHGFDFDTLEQYIHCSIASGKSMDVSLKILYSKRYKVLYTF